jgi:cytochrome d ubiquinol oxidase subunit II
VWEANHVWLIFVLVVLWTGFSSAFAAVVTTLYIPLTLAAFGMIARGAAFAFRKSITTLPMRRFLGAAFACRPWSRRTSSAPSSAGRLRAGAARDRRGRRHHQLGEPDVGARRRHGRPRLRLPRGGLPLRRRPPRGEPDLADEFRIRALGTAAVTGAVGLAGLFVLRSDAPLLWDGLTGRALPVIGTVRRRRGRGGRLPRAEAVRAGAAGLGARRHDDPRRVGGRPVPYVLVPDVTIEEAASGRATLQATLVALGTVR